MIKITFRCLSKTSHKEKKYFEVVHDVFFVNFFPDSYLVRYIDSSDRSIVSRYYDKTDFDLWTVEYSGFSYVV